MRVSRTPVKRSFTITIPGEPIAQGRPRFSTHGKFVKAYDPKKSREGKDAIKYFVDTHRWAETDDVEIFYFAAFDEDWKVSAEGDVGAYWGLWDKNGNPKYV